MRLLILLLLPSPALALTPTTQPLQFRPLRPDQTRCDIAGLYIHDISDSKGINITPTAQPAGPGWFFRSITIRNCLLERINRTPAGERQGLHTDFIRICGDGDKQTHPADVLIEDVTLRDGSSLPLLIQDGWFNVTLRRLKIENTTTSAQICAINTGRFDQITIEDCPNLRVALMGRPGSIGTVTSRNSPNTAIGDTMTKNGRSGAKIIQEPPPAQPTTKPATQRATTQPTAATQPTEDRDLTIQGRRYRLIDLPPDPLP